MFKAMRKVCILLFNSVFQDDSVLAPSPETGPRFFRFVENEGRDRVILSGLSLNTATCIYGL
jgi:hypothetical protein